MRARHARPSCVSGQRQRQRHRSSTRPQSRADADGRGRQSRTVRLIAEPAEASRDARTRTRDTHEHARARCRAAGARHHQRPASLPLTGRRRGVREPPQARRCSGRPAQQRRVSTQHFCSWRAPTTLARGGVRRGRVRVRGAASMSRRTPLALAGAAALLVTSSLLLGAAAARTALVAASGLSDTPSNPRGDASFSLTPPVFWPLPVGAVKPRGWCARQRRRRRSTSEAHLSWHRAGARAAASTPQAAGAVAHPAARPGGPPGALLGGRGEQHLARRQRAPPAALLPRPRPPFSCARRAGRRRRAGAYTSACRTG